MLISDWLRRAFDDVTAIHAVDAVALGLVGDIAASAEPTARVLVSDRFVDDPWPTPIATVPNIVLGTEVWSRRR
jgi:hypothetical protein